MNANSNASANHAGPTIIVLCDQGGVRMDISNDTASTLRAQGESHPPVICVQFCGDRTDGTCSEDKAYCIPKNPISDRQQAVCIPLTNRGIVCEGGVCETVRAESHGALPLICFTQNQRDEVRELGDVAGSLQAESGMHQTNYILTESAHRWDAPCQTGAFMGGQGAKARSIAWREDGTTPTLKSTPSGGNTIPDVVYPVNLMVVTRGGKDDMRTCFGIGKENDPQFTLSSAHEHGVCYEVKQGG